MIKQNDTDNTAISKKQTEEENHTLEFFMPMDPPTATHQLKQVRVMGGKPIFYEPAKVKDARAKLLSHLVKNAPETPFCGPVSLCVKWCFPAKSHKPGTWRDTKPDTDNLQKLLKDCMTESGFWNDDAQVVQEIIEKFWWDTPGIYICIRSLAQYVYEEKQGQAEVPGCDVECMDCKLDCACRDCRNEDKWQWRGPCAENRRKEK